MFVDPRTLQNDLDTLEKIEKASLRMVTQAIVDFREEAVGIFQAENDKPQDIAEDITREALDAMGVSRVQKRLFGKIDYKRAHYLFLPEHAVRQALFVDSKAEKDDTSATIQTSQTSMEIRHIRKGAPVAEKGSLPDVIRNGVGSFLATTVFVLYYYVDQAGTNTLRKIIVSCIPSRMLQDRYNPTPDDTIWRAGRNAPTLGEPFRVRLAFSKLKGKENWRVQTVEVDSANFVWDE